MTNLSKLIHSENPIERAMYWLAHASWGGITPNDFEILQDLVKELRQYTDCEQIKNAKPKGANNG